MKLNFDPKNKQYNLDVGAEKLIEKGMDQHERTWKDKFITKHNAKKEILELKHKMKMEEKKGDKEKEREEELKLELEEKVNRFKITVRIISIILFMFFGLLCIVGFRDGHTIAAIIGLIQTILLAISILTSSTSISFFKEDYKVCLIISLLLVIPWMAFAA